MTRSYGPGRACCAFTLIEVMVCIVIAAALATIATASLRAGRRDATLRSAVLELQSQDRLMREHARQSGRPVELRFDLATGGMARREIDRDGGRVDVPVAVFGGDDGAARVEAIITSDGRAGGETVRIGCSVSGRTPSYAALIACREQRQWILFVGLTGHSRIVQDEAELQDIFPSTGHDAR
jgi:prepilin-type N-terminal cleavage/methylation domain-containing protein